MIYCDGWEIVCPDGHTRHFPYHNHGDAVADAAAATEKQFCQLYPKPSEVLQKHGPCPEGEHTVRALRFPHAQVMTA